MAKHEKIALGTVVLYGNPNYKYSEEDKAWVPTDPDDKTPTVEILEIQEIDREYIRTSKYVLPLSDATVSTSNDGLVYSFNASLPYIQETAHLAEVEKNIIVNQAFLYAGRANSLAKPPIMQYVLIGILALLAIMGFFK